MYWTAIVLLTLVYITIIISYLVQGYKVWKVISEAYACFVLQSILSLGGKVNTRSYSDTRETLGIYSCLQKPPIENWFQYIRREYATAINYLYTGVHIIPSNRIPNVDWLILGAEIYHIASVNNRKYYVKLKKLHTA